MNKDISFIFEDWAFDPSDICARKITGLDGREKLQVRLDLGVLQMELTGRPDGKCPFECATALDAFLDRLEAHRTAHDSDETFRLDADACAELGQESLLYYHRYICLLRLGDYEAVIRDTQHCLAIFDLVRSYAEDEEDRLSFEQYRPYVVMIHTRARGEIRLQKEDFDGALSVIQGGIDHIRSLADQLEDMESNEELEALEAWAEEIRQERPISLQQRLKQQLQDAIAEERYELAARLRDRLRSLENTNC